MRISDWSCVCSSDLSKQTLAGPSKDKMMSNLQSHQTSPTEADIAAAKNAWNAVADEFNQWDNLSVDEQEKWQGRFADHADAQFPALARLRSALKDDPDDIAAGVPECAIEEIGRAS